MSFTPDAVIIDDPIKPEAETGDLDRWFEKIQAAQGKRLRSIEFGMLTALYLVRAAELAPVDIALEKRVHEAWRYGVLTGKVDPLARNRFQVQHEGRIVTVEV